MSAMCVAFVPMAALGAGYSCPDGYTSDAGAATINQCYKSISAGSYWDGDEVKTCTAGITKLRVGNVSVPLYATRQTTPAIAIRHNNAVCYSNLATGDARSQININYGGKTYHSTE